MGEFAQYLTVHPGRGDQIGGAILQGGATQGRSRTHVGSHADVVFPKGQKAAAIGFFQRTPGYFADD